MFGGVHSGETVPFLLLLFDLFDIEDVAMTSVDSDSLTFFFESFFFFVCESFAAIWVYRTM